MARNVRILRRFVLVCHCRRRWDAGSIALERNSFGRSRIEVGGSNSNLVVHQVIDDISRSEEGVSK